jgi:hypothetical protein|tara:strand:- start:218 stop:406 length:189 start_codon:yes stop_codon:yes gene_type:complete
VNPYEDNVPQAFPMDEKDITDVYQLPSSKLEGSDYLDRMIQLDLVKNKKGKDFLNRYMGMTA